MQLAHKDADDFAFVDLYSCFPSAVQIGAQELGFGLDRDLTVTGGLCFAGGPWNNYVMHAIATMVQRLREDPGAFGFVERERRLRHEARVRDLLDDTSRRAASALHIRRTRWTRSPDSSSQMTGKATRSSRDTP